MTYIGTPNTLAANSFYFLSLPRVLATTYATKAKALPKTMPVTKLLPKANVLKIKFSTTGLSMPAKLPPMCGGLLPQEAFQSNS